MVQVTLRTVMFHSSGGLLEINKRSVTGYMEDVGIMTIYLKEFDKYDRQKNIL